MAERGVGGRSKRKRPCRSREFADAHNNLGNLLHGEHKDVAGAESAYRDAIAADPKFVLAHNNLEYLLNNMKDN